MQPAPEDCFEMATTAHAEGRLDEAITRYEECLRNDPDDAVVLSLLGAVHTAQGRAPEGRILLERSVQLDPENEIAGRPGHRLKLTGWATMKAPLRRFFRLEGCGCHFRRLPHPWQLR